MPQHLRFPLRTRAASRTRSFAGAQLVAALLLLISMPGDAQTPTSGLTGSGAAAALACTLDRATGTRIDAEPFLRNGYVARWNAVTNRIAYMQPDAGGY